MGCRIDCAGRARLGALALGALVASAATTQQPATTAGADAAPAIADTLLEAFVPRVDDPGDRALALLRTAATHAAHPASALLIDAARRVSEQAHGRDRLLGAVDNYLGAQPHGLGHAAALGLRTSLLLRAGRRGAELEDPHGDVAEPLLAVGPFGDEGDHYGGVPFAPELRFPDPDTPLPGRFGAVKPRVVERARLRSTLDLAPDGPHAEGCHYGLHQLHAETASPCFVEVRSSGSFELFVNGELVRAVDRAVQRAANVQRLPAMLRAGVNLVLVKTTTNRRSTIGLRYLDGAGRPLATIRTLAPDTVRQPGAPAGPPAELSEFVDGTESLARAGMRSEGTQRRRLLLAAILAAQQDRDHDRAMPWLAALEQDPPQTPRLILAHARALDGADWLPAELRNARARALRRGLPATAADGHHATLERARALDNQDRGEDAIRLLQRRVADGHAGPETFDQLYRILQRLRFTADAEALLAPWRERWPADVRPVLAAVSARRRGGDMAGALALAREANATAPHPALRRSVLDLASDLGQAELALAQLEPLFENDPTGAAALQARAETLARLGRDADAAAVDATLIDHPALDARSARDIAARCLLRDDRDGAQRALARVLQLSPGDAAARRTAAMLTGDDAFAELAPFRRDADEILAGFRASDRERGASSSLVLDQMIVRVFDDGSAVEEVHQIRRINDLRGVELYQEARNAANAAEVLRLRTVGTDGESYVPHRVARSYGMPRLEPGAFIEERYRNYEAAPGASPWRATEFYFRSTDEPFLLTELVMILPEEHQGRFRTRNMPAPTEVQELDGGLRAFVFRMTDVPRLPSERRAPPIDELVPIVTFGEDANPDAAARAAYRTAERRAIPDPTIRAKAAELTLGVQGDTAKAAAIYRYAQEQIADGGSTDPTEIVLTGRGQRFFAITALLRAASVPFDHARTEDVHARFLDSGPPLFLGEEEYRIPALRVTPTDGAVFWLFADSPRHYPSGAIPAERFAARALLLRAGGGEPTRLPDGDAAAESGYDVRGTLALTEDGTAELRAEATLRGVIAYGASSRIATLEESTQQIVARQLAGQVFDGWSLGEVELTGLDAGARIGARVVVSQRDALSTAGEELLLRLPFPPIEFSAGLGDRAQRHLPLVLTDLQSSSWEVTVSPAPHFRLLELPTPVRLQHALVDFYLGVERDGDTVRLRRELVLRPGRVPASQFAEWLDLLRRLDLAEQQTLRLQRR